MKLLDTQTGEIVEIEEKYVCADHNDVGEFMWTEGNYACDCNRALFHARARGVADPTDLPCGDTRYQLLDAPWEDKQAD